MKKRLFLLPILAVMFSFFMVGCGADDKSEVSYNKQVLIDSTKKVVQTYGELSEAEENYYLTDGSKLEQTAANGFKQAKDSDKVGEFKCFDTSEGNVSIEPQSDGSILCAIIAQYTNRDVKITVKYKKNSAYEMTKAEVSESIQSDAISSGYASIAEYLSDVNAYLNVDYGTNLDTWIDSYLAANGESEYVAQECEVSAVYSKGELLAKAGRNTAIGMGTVFIVLIFISFIISLLKYVPALVGGKKKEEPKKAAPVKAAPVAAPVAAPAVKTENLMNDAELVAVITAAIYALESEAGTSVNAVSKDTLVVRSIRRAR